VFVHPWDIAWCRAVKFDLRIIRSLDVGSPKTFAAYTKDDHHYVLFASWRHLASFKSRKSSYECSSHPNLSLYRSCLSFTNVLTTRIWSVVVSFRWGGVRLSRLGTSPTNWPVLPAPVDKWWWMWSIRWLENWQEEQKYSEKTCPNATLSTTNPTWHWARTRAAAVESRRLTAWAVTEPSNLL
jgi:hypothetical protein